MRRPRATRVSRRNAQNHRGTCAARLFGQFNVAIWSESIYRDYISFVADRRLRSIANKCGVNVTCDATSTTTRYGAESTFIVRWLVKAQRDFYIAYRYALVIIPRMHCQSVRKI